MNLRVCTASLLVAYSGSAGAMDATGDTPPDGLRAVLETPTLFGVEPCSQRSGGKYPLYAGPAATTASLGTLEADAIPRSVEGCSRDLQIPRVRKPGDAWTTPVPVIAFRQGHPGLVVTDAHANWIRILLASGEAWLLEPPGAVVHNYGNLVIASPVHLLRGWDGRVCSNPRLEDCRKMAMPSNPAVRINRMQTFGADLWFKVEFGIGACEGPDMPGRDVLSGWIPAYGSASVSGKRPLTLWVDPKGC